MNEIDKLAQQLNDNTLQHKDLTVDFIKKSQQRFEKTLNEIKASSIAEVVEKDLKRWVDRIFTYMYDFSNIKFDNLSEKQNAFIKRYNLDHSMTLKHSIASRIKSSTGRVAYLVNKIQDEVVTEIMEVVGNPTYIGSKLIKVNLTKNSITQINQIEYNIVFEIALKGQDVTITKILIPNDEDLNSITSTSKVIKGIGYIPVVIDYSNEEGVPEWQNVSSAISFYASFEKKVQIEFEYLKTQLKLNPQYSYKNAKAMQDEIEGGDTRIHEDYNTNMENSLTYLSSGGVTSDIARSIRDDYKAQIKEYLFIIGSNQSGTKNMHTTEVANQNIYSYSYAWFKKNMLSETLSKLYWMILDRIGVDKPDYLECTANLSRPLELVLNLNAEGKELDTTTTKSIREDTVETTTHTEE